VLVAASCGGDDSSTDVESASEASAQSEPAPEPTAEPEPEPDPTATPEPEPTATPEPEPTATPEPEPTPEPVDGFAPIRDAVQAFVDDRELNGAGLIVVHRDDGVLFHEHFGEFTEDRVSLIASSSKMISAGVLLKLQEQEQGLLDIDAPVSDVVEWGSGNPAVTPAQLLSNSSGLVGLGPDLLYGPYLCQWGPDDALESCGQTVFTSADDDEDVISPDTEFRYGGAQWQVAGAVAEAASGKPWAQLIHEIYAEPCGLDSLGYINLGSVVTGFGYPVAFGGDATNFPSDNPNIEGGAYVTTGDYGELLLMHLRGGSCGDTQVLNQDSLDTMHADRIAAVYGGDASGAGSGYGMGWWVDRETGRISDGGAFGTVPWLDLDDGYGAYLVIEDMSATGQELAAEIEELVHAAVTTR